MSPRLTVPVGDLVDAFTAEPRFARHIEAVHRLAARPAREGPWPPELDPRARAAAGGLGFERLYTHQAAAVAATLAGRHVAVATGTASGKSLCYLLPLADAAVRSPGARALLLFPTKALARDQLAALRLWDEALPGAELLPAAYDGDTPRSRRGAARRSAHVIVTNPDMLHTGILPHHPSWAAFFEGLTHVVVDEMHVYRGVFGSHVANVLRRLRRVAAFYGAHPRFILTSATIANPGELGARLSGAPIYVVNDDGAPRGPRRMVLYNPPVVDEALNIRRSALLESELVARHFLAGGVQTIVFARTRQAAELVVRYVTEAVAEDAGRAAEDQPEVRGYRGGYTAGERRAIEAALRDGSLRGVVATNALELGIDIGQLDACVMAGYPGTIASTWQQAGRAGRREGEAAAVLVASAGPLDQFIVRHPDYLFGQPPEHARIDPDNLLILLDHVRCAAFELPFGAGEAGAPFGTTPPPAATDDDGSAAGDPATDPAEGEAIADQPGRQPPAAAEILAVLEAQGVVRRADDTWYWLADAYPAADVSLRSAGPDVVAIVRPLGVREGEAADPANAEASWNVLGTVERHRAPLVVFPGAVYLHGGRTYSVTELDWDGGRAIVVPTDDALYTRASARVDVTPTRVDGERAAPGAALTHGELEVTTRATSYRKVRFRTHETVGWGKIDLPEQRHVAGGYWFTLNDTTVERLAAIGRWGFDPSGDRGPSWPTQRAMALERDERRCRLCGAAEPPGRQHDVHHIRPFRTFGWVPGANDNHRAANATDNLITLCRACHRSAERALGLHGALSGVGYALAHIAPIYLMCDAGDLGVTTEAHARWTGAPTVAVYERAAAGVGFGETLFALHERLIGAAADLIADCPCAAGCPSCVGPAGEGAPDAKAHALAVLAALNDVPGAGS